MFDTEPLFRLNTESQDNLKEIFDTMMSKYGRIINSYRDLRVKTPEEDLLGFGAMKASARD